MSVEPISVNLGPYEKLEILREERENLAKHLAAVERSLRDILREVERQKYLVSLAPYYRSSLQRPEGVARVQQLEELRASIVEAQAAVDRAYQEAEGAAARAPAGAAAARRPSGSGSNIETFRRKR